MGKEEYLVMLWQKEVYLRCLVVNQTVTIMMPCCQLKKSYEFLRKFVFIASLTKTISVDSSAFCIVPAVILSHPQV
jgi:hypothetical protein